MTSTELVPANSNTDVATADHHGLSLSEQWKFAEAVASSGIVPKAYRGDTGAVLVAVNLGQAMNLSPAESLYRIHVIEGKPSASAELIASNVRRAGHRLRVSGDANRAVCQIIRSDDPDYTYEAEWTTEDAQRAKLTGKDVWQKYPKRMLRARAITDCAKDACPEALYGVTSVEEARDIDGEVVTTVTRESASDVLAPQQETTAEHPDLATSGQVQKIGILIRELGITERPDALRYVVDIAGREVGSRKELTKDEAHRVIDQAEADKAAREHAAEAGGPHNDAPDNPGFASDQ